MASKICEIEMEYPRKLATPPIFLIRLRHLLRHIPPCEYGFDGRTRTKEDGRYRVTGAGIVGAPHVLRRETWTYKPLEIRLRSCSRPPV